MCFVAYFLLAVLYLGFFTAYFPVVRPFLIIFTFLLCFAPQAATYAQSISLNFEDAPLPDALAELGTQSGIEFIYSVNLVKNYNISCSFAGEDAEEALGCLLQKTAIHAKKLHDRQYILAPLRQPPPMSIQTKTVGTISGTVTDAVSQVRLPGAHIYLPELRRGTTTNQGGRFFLPSIADSFYVAHISYLGYRAIDTLLTIQNIAHIALEPVTLETNMVVVEGSNDDHTSLASVPGLVALDVEDLDTAPNFGGENDLFQTLRWTPGVHKAGALNNELLIRGGLADQNLYLLDGAPVYHPWHAFNLVSTFQTDAFQEIKLYRGSFPAQHGGRLSSVLDAELKDGNRSKPRAVAGFSLLSGRFMIESPLTSNSSFMLSGRRSYLDKVIGSEHPVQDNSGARDTLRTGYHFSDITGKFTIRPNAKHRLSVSYYSGSDILDLRLPFDLSLDFSSWLRPAELFFEVDHHWGNRMYNLQHQYLASSRLLVTTTAYRSSYNANEGELVHPTSSSLLQSVYHVRVRDIGIRSDIDYSLNPKHLLQGGIHLVDHQFDSSLEAAVQRSAGAIEITNQQSSLQAFEAVGYVQDTWEPTTRWKIQPGLRLSYFSGGKYAYLSPRLNVQHVINPQYLILKGSVGSQVQYMQRLKDRYSYLYDLVSSRWIPTSKNIRPSTSTQISIEAESHPTPWMHVATEVYYRASKDILLPRDEFQTKDGIDGPGIEVATLLAQYTSGLARAYGAELTTVFERGPWKMLFNYAGGRTLSRAPQLGETSFRPTRFDVPRSVRTAITRQYDDWHLTISALLRSGYPITVPEAKYVLEGPTSDEPTQYLYRPNIYNGRLPAYTRFDLSFGYRFDMLGAKWHTQFHIYNFTNRRNIIDRFYDPSHSPVKVQNRRGLPILPFFEIDMEL